MSKKGFVKTNAMRLLEQAGLAYTPHSYEGTASLSAEEVARVLGVDPARVFKTLVTLGKSGEHYVFVLPAVGELDLKKAAQACGEKSVAMLKQKDLLLTTGYVHGGCSPLGMKKEFPTVIDASAEDQPTILVSAGKIGFQMEVEPRALAAAFAFRFADLTQEKM